MLPLRMISVVTFVSSARMSLKPVGVVSVTTIPIALNLARTSGMRAASLIALFMRLTMSSGRPAGPMTPNHSLT